MDHLPVISSPLYPLPEIPYLGHIISYDGKGFFGFPERQGWTVKLVAYTPEDGFKRQGFRPKGVETPSLQEIEAFLQAWLFFGVLDGFLKCADVKVDFSSFIKSDRKGEPRYLTTKPLLTIFEDFHTPYQDNPEQDRKFEEAMSILAQMKSVLSKGFENTLREWLHHHNVSTDILSCLLVLGETLVDSIRFFWPETSPSRVKRTSFQLRWLSGPYHKMLQQRFATGGYCQYEVEMIFDIFENNFTALYVGSQIERPYSRLVLGHGKCDANHCVALNTDSRTYQQRHSRDCKDRGDCNPVFVDMNSIVQVIENDDVPIVSIAEDIHGNPQLRIIPMSEARDRYVAVSHVWAHGRGNPNANALPVCQLWSLVHVLRKLIGVKSVLQPCEFWIDTLCIPVGAEHKILRKRAIEKIDMVFRESRSVLVLDADLELSQSPMSPTELALRVITSGWVRRLWTLSEAVLSRDGYGTQKLLFAFLDGIKSFDSIFELSNSERNELSRSDNSKILTAFAYLFPLNVDRNQRFPNVLDFLGSLEYRSTSRIEDEPLCLSSIVGYDIPRILQYNTHEERMRELYLMMKTVPVSILSHRRERLNIRGFSWAPYSFMSGKAKEWNIHVTSRQQQDIQAAEVTTAGLILPPTTKIVHIDPSTITDLTTNNNNYYYSYYSTYQNQPRYMYSIPNVDPNPSTQKFHSIGLPPNNNITSPTADFFISFMTQTVYQQQINLFISSCRSSNTNKPYTPAIILHTSRFNKNEGLLVGIYKTPEPPIPKEKHKPTPGDTTRTDNMGNGIRILLHRCFYFCRVYLWPHSETELKSVGNGTILGTTILDDKVKEDSGIRYIIE